MFGSKPFHREEVFCRNPDTCLSAGYMSYPALEGLYSIHDELGSGGFGKVKLATHLLTGLKVAIKIIDKKAIGDDLPRVTTELDALRTLSHQNICRLYQFIDTEDKFFIIMELPCFQYCSGGEMFDYIVKKERLEESEARHFFRQLVQAMAYVHSMGYAHRDLKPENLLLTEDLHLKVIDFGLCAKPTSLTRPLDTCCGSPAYAAPELIAGKAYLGNEADIWSMGVLLYALLCGSLPFEDESMQLLYRKIARGQYHEPEWLSPSSRSLLRSMLQVNPQYRITVRQLLDHPWINHKYSQKLKWTSIYDRNVVDEEVATELAFHHRKSLAEMTALIKEWKFDYLTATYYLLLQQKGRRRKIALPPPRPKPGETHVTASPTIHASLENNLDLSGLEDSPDIDLSPQSFRSGSSISEQFDAMWRHNDRDRGDTRERDRIPHKGSDKTSYINAIFNSPTVCTGRSPQQRLAYRSPATTNSTPYRPVQKSSARAQGSIGYECGHDKENYRAGAASVRVRGPVKILESPAFSGGKTPCDSSRQPRSTAKTPRLKQRVFASLERKADRVINLLTPRKLKNDSPQVLKTVEGKINVSVTNSTDPERIRQELIKVFEQQCIKYEVNGWKISGRQKDKAGHALTVELEVVVVENMGKIGIRRKRLCGDAFLYKKVCEQILRMAGLDAD
ncbi:kinase domain protein [Ancylostoma caninum]|uniref:non-specific serine/threonine protein kinase n=1 Tax=Ancylostoma caninum TaxID=29170 RepID=A0A368H1F2_ANCCA|nr:kinase domain protein [Ancylostoma caninum]